MSYKLTQEQANELFTRMGVEVVVVAEADAEAGEPKFDDLIGELRPEVDADNGSKVNEAEVKGKAIGLQLGSLRSLFAQHFAIKRADLDNLDQKDMIPKLKSILESRYTQTEAGLRQQLEEATTALNEQEERLNSEWQKKLDDENARFEERDIQDRFVAVLNKIPRSGGDVVRQAQMLLKEAKSDYIVKFNPTTKQVEFYDKANPEIKVMDGKNALSDEIFGDKFVDTLGLKVSGTQHINPNDLKSQQGGQGTPRQPENKIQELNVDQGHLKSAVDKMREKVEAQLEEGQ